MLRREDNISPKSNKTREVHPAKEKAGVQGLLCNIVKELMPTNLFVISVLCLIMSLLTTAPCCAHKSNSAGKYMAGVNRTITTDTTSAKTDRPVLNTLQSEETRLQSEMPNFDVLRNGLPSPSCRSLYQDSRGFLWIGTNNGVTRYDGSFTHHFAVREPGEDKKRHKVLSINEDTISNCLWCVLDYENALLRIDLETYESNIMPYALVGMENKVQKNFIFNTVSIDDTTLLCRALYSFYTLDKRTGNTQKVFEVPDIISSSKMNFFTQQNQLYCVGGGRIYTIERIKNNDNWVYDFRECEVEGVKIIKDAMPLTDSTLVVMTFHTHWGQDFWSFNPRTGKKQFMGTTNGNAHDFCVANDGIWTASNMGLHFIRYSDWQVFNYTTSNSTLHDNNLSCIIKLNHQPILYIGSEDGVIKLNYYASKFYMTDMRRFSNARNGLVWSVAKDTHGTTWVGGADGLFMRHKDELYFNEVELDMDKTRRQKWVLNIFETLDRDGMVATSSHGIYLLDHSGKVKKKLTPISTSDNVVRRMQPLADHKAVITMTYEVDIVDLKNLKLKTILNIKDGANAKAGQRKTLVSSHTEDGKILWLATRNNEILKLDLQSGETKEICTLPDSCGTVRNMRFNSKGGVGELWICTTLGGLLYKIPGMPGIRKVERSKYLEFNVNTMEVDNDGNAWVATEVGLVRLAGQSTREFSPDVYHICRQFNTSNSSKGPNGEILMGGKNSFVEFQPNLFSTNSFFPDPVIASYRFANSTNQTYDSRTVNEVIYGSGDIEIPAGLRTIEIFTRVLNYDRPQDNRIMWHMDKDTTWQTVNSTSRIIITNLSEGNHTLHMRSMDYEGMPTGNEVQVTIHKDVFFYQTTLFKTLMMMVAVLLAFGLIWWRTQLNKRIQIKLENEVNTMSGMLIKANKELRAKQLIISEQNEELAHINADLESKVAERTAELEAARAKAEESSQLKSTFLASLGHEIRTPMNAIIGFAKLLQMEDCTNEERTEFTHLILESSNSLLYIIGGLLDTSRIERGMLEISKVDIDIYNELKDVWHILSVEKKSRNVKFLLDLDEGLKGMTLHSDKDRLRQIIINLTYNAFKFTQDGHIKISACCMSYMDMMTQFNMPQIDKNTEDYINTTLPTEVLLVSVEDTGCGIPEDKQEAIFEPFRRLTDSRTKHPGLGLGLNIVRNLVHLMGGRVWVKSVVGEGSTFRFYLPF